MLGVDLVAPPQDQEHRQKTSSYEVSRHDALSINVDDIQFR